MFIPPISYVHELIERSGTVAAEFTSNNCLSSLSSISTTSQCTDINNCRTWYDIVWSCVSVLVACTWVSVHPNVPGPDEGALWHKIGLMLVMIIAPELLVLWAARQWFAARKLASRYRLEGWTKTHAFYALMGGFALYSDGKPVSVLRFIPSEGTKALILEHFERSDAPPSAIGTPDSHTSHLTDSPIASDVKKKPTSHTEMKVMPKRPELDDRSLVAHIRDIAQTTLEDMHDRSDSDSFGKLIAVGQTVWFVIQLLTRWIEGLVVTELEVMTLAFAAMSVLIYFFWWDKPQGIQCQVHIRARQKTLLATAQKELPAELVQSTDSSKPKHSTWLQTQMEKKFSITKDNFHQMGVLGKTFLFVVWIYLTLVDAIVGTILVPADDVDLSDAPTQRISSFERTPSLEPKHPKEYPKDKFIALGAAVMFGAIHCTAWKSQFPSFSEEVLWKVASLVTTFIPLYLAYHNFMAHKNWFPSICDGLIITFYMLSVPLYFLARLSLILQPFLALRNLPPGAFRAVQWTNPIPHI